jgi:L-lysine exporter family protein LysE/ArgO
MPDLPSFLTGFALSAGLIIAIGAQNAFVLRQGLRREHVGPVVLFCALADLALMAAGVAGLGAALERLPGLVTVLALGGAVFLAWYGLTALRRAARPERLLAEGAGAALSLGGALARVAGFTLLNPHVYLDTVLLVGSVGAAQPIGAQAPFVAGAGLASAAWFAALGFGARLLAPLFARPAAWRVLDLLVGATMIALAVGLARYALAGGA